MDVKKSLRQALKTVQKTVRDPDTLRVLALSGLLFALVAGVYGMVSILI